MATAMVPTASTAAAVEPEPTAKKRKTDDVMAFGGAGQKYSELILQRKIAVFELVHDLTTTGTTIAKALKPTCMNKTAYFDMKENIGKIKKVVENHPHLLHHCIPKEILRFWESDQLKQDDVINEEEMVSVVIKSSNHRSISQA